MPDNGNGETPTTPPPVPPNGWEAMYHQSCMQLFLVGLQGVSDNQRLAQNTLMAYQKDLFQGGQGEFAMMKAALKAGAVPMVVTE